MEIARIPSSFDRDGETRMKEDLEPLSDLAIKEGAHKSVAVSSKDLVFTEMTMDLSDVPLEEQSIFWPAPRFPNDSIQAALKEYLWAVVFRIDLNDQESLDRSEGQNIAFARPYYSPDNAQMGIFKIAGLLEAACFYRGYYLSIGLAAGNCKQVLCQEERKCQALTVGKPCRHPLRSRPSIEACGLDLEEIARKAGWNDLAKKQFLTGMVFVG